MKKILLLLLLCCSGVSLFSQSQNTYLSKMSDTLFKQSMIRNMENHYMLWGEREDTLSDTDIISEYLERKLFDSAEMSIRKVSKLSVDKAFFPFSMCVCKMVENQYDSAFYYANQTLLVDPFHAGALHNKAYIYYHARRLDQASSLYAQLINLESDNPENYFLKAEVDMEAGRIKEAVDLLKTAENLELTLDQQINAVQKLARAYLFAYYLNNKQVKSIDDPFENAKLYIQKGIELDSTQVFSYYLRTLINYTEETDAGYEAVIADYKRTARIDSTLQLTCDFAIANCLFYLHKPKEAVDLLNASIDKMGENYCRTLDLDDLSLVTIIREMRDLPLYQHEENEVYFNLLSGALSLRFSQQELSRILKKVNKKMPPSNLTTRFNIYFAKNSTVKLHMEYYGNYMTWCDLSRIFEKSEIVDTLENVDLMWSYAHSLEYCKHKPKGWSTKVKSAYQSVLEQMPSNINLKWDYATYLIYNEMEEDALAYIRPDLDENSNANYQFLGAKAYTELKMSDSANYFIDALLRNDTISPNAWVYLCKIKADLAYELSNFETLHEAYFTLNQLDPLTPYYYSQEALLRFIKKPDAKQTEQFMRRMKKCEMPQNEQYYEAFKGALLMLSGEAYAAKSYSLSCRKKLLRLNQSYPQSPYDVAYFQKVENMNNLLNTLSMDEKQSIANLYIYFSSIVSAPGYKSKIGKVKEVFMNHKKQPNWIEAYQVLWCSEGFVEDSLSQSQLQMCLKIEPKNVVAITYSAYFYVKSGEYQKAVDAAEKAEQYTPYCANAVWFKALALYEMGKPEEAEEAITKYYSICTEYGITTHPKFIKMGKKMLKECGIER